MIEWLRQSEEMLQGRADGHFKHHNTALYLIVRCAARQVRKLGQALSAVPPLPEHAPIEGVADDATDNLRLARKFAPLFERDEAGHESEEVEW